jgi:hypothetical protein
MQGQSFKEGIQRYNEANMAHTISAGGKEEMKKLNEAYTIFKNLASEENKEALIMYYLVSTKLKKTFSQPLLLNNFIKHQHPTYATIKGLPILEPDKQTLLNDVRKLAEQNRQKALALIKQAALDYKVGKYGDALDKINEAGKIWKIENINEKRYKYSKKKKQHTKENLEKQIVALAAKGLYKDALDLLEKGKETLDPGKVAALKGDIKNKWYQKTIAEAKTEGKNKHWDLAIKKCDDAYKIVASNEALKLKRKYERKKQGYDKGRFALILDFSVTDPFKIHPDSYEFAGNSRPYVFLRDSSEISAEMKVNKEDEAKVGYGFSGGLAYLFSPNFGISFNISSLLKQKFYISNDYTFDWTWASSGYSYSRSKKFMDSGTISATPISINLLILRKLANSTILNIYAGPTLFLSKLDLTSHFGYGTASTKNDGYNWVDWYPFEYHIKENTSVLGANIGINLEIQTRTYSNAYIGFQYLVAPNKEFNWKLYEKKYDGELGNFYTTEFEGRNLPKYKSEINLSTLKFNMGVKYYF